MTRLALVTPILPVPQDPTRGRFIFETAKALAKQADVRVFLQQTDYLNQHLPWAQAGATPPLQGTVDLGGLAVEAGTYPALPMLSRPLNGWLSGRSVTPGIAAFKPDAVIGYWVYPEGAGALQAARRLGVPGVIGALGTDIHMRSGLNAWLTRRTLQRADAVITVSEAMTRYTRDQHGVPGERITTIVNGFNTGIFHPRPNDSTRQRLGVPAGDPLMLYVGRLIEAKGLLELIDAFQDVLKQHPRARLALAGEGPLKSGLQALAEQRQLSDRIQLLGGLPPDQVADWMSCANLLTLPSWSEGYPNVLVEALACGCPVVASRVGGIPEIVTDHNGIMHPARDARALGRSLSQALERAWDRPAIAQACTRTWDDVASETLAVCRQLIARRAG